MLEAVQKKSSLIRPAPPKTDIPKSFAPPKIPVPPQAFGQELNESGVNKPYSSQKRDLIQKKVLENLEATKGSDAAVAALQRKCAACEREDVIQAKQQREAIPEKSPLEIAASGFSGTPSRLPHLEQIQQSFGIELSHVQAFIGGAATRATQQLGASAYTCGNRIAFGKTPSLGLTAHEAAHVVQQQSGKVQLQGGVGQVGDEYERHADAMAERVVQGQDASALLGEYGGGESVDVQEKSSEVVYGKSNLSEVSEGVQLRKDEELALEKSLLASTSEQLGLVAQRPVLVPPPVAPPVAPPVVPPIPTPAPAPGFRLPKVPLFLLPWLTIPGMPTNPIPTAPSWQTEINPFTRQPYSSEQEYERVQQQLRQGYPQSGQPGINPDEPYGPPSPYGLPAPRTLTPGNTSGSSRPSDEDFAAIAQHFREYGAPYNSRENVIKIQKYLGVNPDGNYGQQTAKAVYLWQESQGLRPDGEVGKTTWDRMFSGVSPTSDTATSSDLSTVEPSNLPSVEESQRRIQVAQAQQQQYATFDELSRKLDESENKFAQVWPEENPIMLLRIIRGTTARLYERELNLPPGSVQFDLGQTPNLEELNREVFNRIFGMILSNLGQLLELKPEIVGQIGGVNIFYEPARYPEFLSRAAVQSSGSNQTVLKPPPQRPPQSSNQSEREGENQRTRPPSNNEDKTCMNVYPNYKTCARLRSESTTLAFKGFLYLSQNDIKTGLSGKREQMARIDNSNKDWWQAPFGELEGKTPTVQRPICCPQPAQAFHYDVNPVGFWPGSRGVGSVGSCECCEETPEPELQDRFAILNIKGRYGEKYYERNGAFRRGL